MEDTIRVALRVRPLSASELARGCHPCIDCIANLPQVVVRNSDKGFTFNYVFGPESSQGAVYDTAVKSLVHQLFKGYNVTILAYGQTGSGKTFSMGTCYNGGEMGIIPRSISDIFEKISLSDDKDFKVTASFMELYKEQFYDLLACCSKPRDQCVVDLREDNKAIHIPGLMEMEVSSAEDAFKALMMGSAGRATGATAMNAQSSRSHAIFTITIQMCKKNNGGEDTVSKFHLVDLAGSERSKKTGATGERFKEGVTINKGLLALGNVISALGDGQQKGYVSYRDSKLTRLLQDSLGGNSMTLMVACVSPADYNCEETLSTLRYADRARHIRNKPIINQDPKTAEILRLQKENTELRLQVLGNGGVVSVCPKEHSDLMEEINTLRQKNRKLTEALNNAINESTNLMERALLAELARDRMNVKLKELNAKCNQTIENFDVSKELSPSSSVRGNLAGLKDLQLKIVELQAEQQHGEDEIKKHELSELSASKSVAGSGETHESNVTATTMTPQSLAELDHQQEKHTFQQAELNKELQELTRALAIKEQLAATLVANSSNISALNPEYHENMKQLESQISALQQERDALHQQLKSVQSNSASSKIAEQRRKRLQELEAQMSDLKKKLLEQSKVIKMKEKSDEKIVVLNNDIRSMKAMKVKLIRQMKQESEQFRNWKLQREKELNKLRDQDRRRQNIMTRMENMHTKQQNVLKRKVEEASAINKRLKEALLLQKQSQDRRQQPQGKSERIQTWVAQELEISASTVAAVRVRDKLVEDRAHISKQLVSIEAALKTASVSEVPSLKMEAARLKEDLELRSAQIADMNQKILDSDQENKAKTRWDTIQSMIDAKCALKHLFELSVDIRKDAAMKEYTIEEMEDALKKLNAEVVTTEEKLKFAEQKYKTEILELDKEHSERVAILLHQIGQKETETALCQTNSHNQMKVLEEQSKRRQSMNVISDEFQKMKDANVALLREVDELKKKLEEKDAFKTPPAPKHKKKPRLDGDIIDVDDVDDDIEVDDDDENDPDWRKTPLFKRLEKSKRKTSVMDNSTHISVKRTSDGMTSCTCLKGVCQKCTCRRNGNSCSENCKCLESRCSNRSKENSMEANSSVESVTGEIKRPRNDGSPLADASNSDLRKRLFAGQGKYFPNADLMD